MIKNKLAEWMLVADNGKPITNGRLARSTGLSETTIRKLKNNPSIAMQWPTIDKICDRWECQPTDLYKYTKG
jgi:DNA-binding Xre family transcriptional regulator